MDEQDQPTTEHRRPDGVDDATVEALGKLSEALEVVEDARGHLYALPPADGHGRPRARRGRRPAARRRPRRSSPTGIETELVGRNVLEGRWTFQIVEEYDDGYYATFKRARAGARATSSSAAGATSSRRR